MPDAETAYLFRHALLRDAARNLHLPSDRARLHGLALEILEAQPGLSHAAIARELADHAAAALQDDLPPERTAELCRAEARHLRVAADTAEGEWHLPEAEVLFARLARLPHAGVDEIAQARLTRGRILRVLGATAQATDLLRETLADPGLPKGLRPAVQCELGSAMCGLGFLDAGVAMIAKAMGTESGELEPPIRRRALRTLSIHLGQLGRGDESLKATLQLEQEARLAGDFALLGDALLQRMLYLEGRAQVQQALDLEPEIWRCFELHGKPGASVAAVINIGTFHYRRGDLDRAEPLFRRAKSEAAATGQRPQEASAVINIAVIMLSRQRFDEAAPLLQQAAALGKELGQLRIEQGALTNLAVLYGQTGRLDEAERTLRRTLELARRIGDKLIVLRNLSNLAAATDALHRPQESILLRREAVALVEQAQMGESVDAFNAWGHLALCLHTLGLDAECRQARHNALDVAAKQGLTADQGLANTRDLMTALQKLDQEPGQ